MADKNIVETFATIVIVSLFYSFAITLLTYSLPSEALTYTEVFSNADNQLNLNNTAQEFQDSLSQQKDIPIVEVGALVFYSGNILLDLLANFYTAIPQMINLLYQAFATLFSFDPVIGAYIQIFTTVLLTVLYILSLMQMLMNIRSGSGLI